MLRDLKSGVRVLAKSPAFATVVILMLALGIGSATAAFSVIYAALLRPFPYPQPTRIVLLRQPSKELGEDWPFSYGFFQDARDSVPAFEGMAAFDSALLTVTGRGEPVAVDGLACSASIFRLLGIRPIVGRVFTRENETPGGEPVALISAEFWRARFRGDRSIVGKTVRLDQRPYAIVGVLPRGVRFPGLQSPPAVWIPLGADPMVAQLKAIFHSGWDQGAYLSLIARLRAGVSLREAQSEARAVLGNYLKEGRQGENPSSVIRLTPLTKAVASPYRTELYILFAALALTLIIACVDVTDLLLARASIRRKETAVRLALGATRRGIWRQMLVESTTLALLGGVAGVGLAYLALHLLARFAPAGLLPFKSVTVNEAALVFSALLLAGCCVALGSLPGWMVPEAKISETLNEAGCGQGEGRRARLVRRGCVVTQIACAVVVLVGFGLLLRTFWRLTSASPGFNPEGITVAEVTLPRPAPGTRGRWKRFASDVVWRLRRQPGVEGAATALSPPGGYHLKTSYRVEGRPRAKNLPLAEYRPVGVRYFSLLGIPTILGKRLSQIGNLPVRRVCVINQALAGQQFGRENPIGAKLAPIGLRPCEVVGVVGDVTSDGLDLPAQPAIYVPFSQFPDSYIQFFLSFLAKGSAPGGDLGRVLRATVWRVDPGVPVKIEPMRGILAASIAPQRFRALIMGALAALALLLALAGVYALLAHSVTRRQHEIAVRMALGASPAKVFGHVVVEGLRLAALGVGTGILVSLPLTRLMRGLLFGVAPDSAPVYLGACALVILVTLVASAVPARRAMRLDPATALRHE